MLRRSDRRLRWAALCACVSTGCGTVIRPPEALPRAERLAAAGRSLEALESFAQAIAACNAERADCRLARLERAELLDQLGRSREAERAYGELLRWTAHPATAARALDRIADLVERQGRTAEAIALSHQLIDRFTEEAAAEDALRRLVRLLGSPQEQGELERTLLELFRKHRRTSLGGNLVYQAARRYEHSSRPREAVSLYDQLATDYPHSPLRDDSLWRSAHLLESMQDWQGALLRYRRLLATRREAWFVGSYNSVHLDDAQLRVGIIQLERLGDLRAALATFEELRDSYKTSLLRDDAQWWIAQAHLRSGQRQLACQDLSQLEQQFPDGNQLRKARQARAELGCPR